MELEEIKNVLLDICIYKGDKDGLTAEEYSAIKSAVDHLIKQEKMIGNIFSYLDDHRIDDNICDEILDYGAKDCIHNGNCTECIKQYFENKANAEEQ